MRKYLIVLLKLLILHHGLVAAFPGNSESDDETVELNDYEDGNISMEELTTMTIINELSSNEADSNWNHESIPQITETTVATTVDHLTTSQDASPILMKLISPIESTKTLNNQTTATTERIDVIMKINNAKVVLDDTEKLNVVATKKPKPRILVQKETLARIPLRNSEHENNNSMEDTTTVPEKEMENNETNSEEITTMLPLVPSTSNRPPKNIEIFKTRPNELLRFYVEDGHLRSPIAALVDKKTNPLNKAKKLWKAALRPNSLLDIMVVSYDSEGIKSTYNLTNTKAMMTTLDKVRDENTTDQESKTYYSIIRTGQLIPFDSAIFVSTDDIPSDTGHQQQASMFLLKKRIRVRIINIYFFS